VDDQRRADQDLEKQYFEAVEGPCHSIRDPVGSLLGREAVARWDAVGEQAVLEVPGPSDAEAPCAALEEEDAAGEGQVQLDYHLR